MKQASKLKAKVTFTTPAEDGRYRRLESGSRSQLKVGEESTSCVILGESKNQIFDYGVEYVVTLELFFWDHYKDRISIGMPVQLCEGDRLVGKGVIEAIVPA